MIIAVLILDDLINKLNPHFEIILFAILLLNHVIFLSSRLSIDFNKIEFRIIENCMTLC